MAKISLDLRKTLRAIATRLQSDNARRLLAGVGVNGESFADRKEPSGSSKSSGKRIRLFGERVPLSRLAGKVGVASGALLRDLMRAGNQRIGRVGFKIIPSLGMLRRHFALTAGSKHQVARPFSGVSGEALRDARDDLAKDGRDQLVRSVNGALRERR